jgi:hypothetical protein
MTMIKQGKKKVVGKGDESGKGERARRSMSTG